MSEENVELHRRVADAFNQAFSSSDVDVLIAHFDPDIELDSTFAAVGGGVCRGYEGIRRWFRDLQDAWGSEIRVEAEAYFDLGERTLTFNLLHGRGRESGAGVAMPGAQVLASRDGRVVHIKGFAHREDALRDLGISEDALEPIAP